MGGCVGQTNTDKPIAVHIPTPPESKEATEIKLLLNRLTERNAELESQILTCQYKVGSLKDLAKHYLKESNFIMAKSKVVEIMRLSKQTFKLQGFLRDNQEKIRRVTDSLHNKQFVNSSKKYTRTLSDNMTTPDELINVVTGERMLGGKVDQNNRIIQNNFQAQTNPEEQQKIEDFMRALMQEIKNER